MKRVFSAIAASLLLASSSLSAQTFKESFSAEGRENWESEFTLRGSVGIFTGGIDVTGGVRIDEKRTLGLMLGNHEIFYNAEPATVKYLNTCLHFRRYFHLGKRKRAAFYSDLIVGAGWIYDVEQSYWVDPATGTTNRGIDDEPGDAYPIISWQPGVRVCYFKNAHLFFGPTLGTNCMGVHIGLGF